MEYAGIIAAIIAFIGAIATGVAGARQAKKQREWQLNLANTSHQREVADLRKAGLNPILSGLGGSGAQTPQGVMFTPNNPMQGVLEGMSSVTNANTQKSRTASQNALDKMQTAYLSSAKDAQESQVELNKALQDKASQESNKVALENLRTSYENDYLEKKGAFTARLNNDLRESSAKAEKAEQEAYRERYRNAQEKLDYEFYGSDEGRYFKHFQRYIQGATGVVRDMK